MMLPSGLLLLLAISSSSFANGMIISPFDTFFFFWKHNYLFYWWTDLHLKKRKETSNKSLIRVTCGSIGSASLRNRRYVFPTFDTFKAKSNDGSILRRHPPPQAHRSSPKSRLTTQVYNWAHPSFLFLLLMSLFFYFSAISSPITDCLWVSYE